MSIIENNFDSRSEIIQNYKFKINDKLMGKINKVLGYTINYEYYDEYKRDNVFYMDLNNMKNLFKKICECYDSILEFNKPLGINEEEYLHFLNRHNRYIKLLNKYFNNGRCLFSIKDIFHKDGFTFEDVEKIVLIFNEIQDNKENMYSFREFKNVMKDVIDSLSYILTDEELNIIKDEYMKLLTNPNNLEALKNLIEKTNQITKQDFIKKLSKLENINEENFSFVVHSIKTNEWNGKFYDPLVSASLINNDVRDLYSYPVGFILDPSSIICANTEDFYTSNSMNLNTFSYAGNLPIIYSYDKIINDCKKRKTENKNNNAYNEIVLTEFKPLAIFYYPDKENLNKDLAINLKRQVEEFYPNLQIIEIGSKVKLLRGLEDNFEAHIK